MSMYIRLDRRRCHKCTVCVPYIDWNDVDWWNSCCHMSRIYNNVASGSPAVPACPTRDNKTDRNSIVMVGAKAKAASFCSLMKTRTTAKLMSRCSACCCWLSRGFLFSRPLNTDLWTCQALISTWFIKGWTVLCLHVTNQLAKSRFCSTSFVLISFVESMPKKCNSLTGTK